MQTALMIIIAAACMASAGVWWHDGNMPSAIAFVGFGLGYIGLAWLFVS